MGFLLEMDSDNLMNNELEYSCQINKKWKKSMLDWASDLTWF